MKMEVATLTSKGQDVYKRQPHLRDAYLGRVRKHLARLQRTGLDALPLHTRGEAGQ